MNLEHALTIAPDIVGELRGRLLPQKSGGERGAPGFTRSAPISLTVLDDADELYAALVEHTEAVAGILDTIPPPVAAQRGTRPTGLPPTATPESAYTDTKRLCRFLTHQTHLIDDNDLREDIERDIVKQVSRLDQKYPATQPKEHVKARCANCQRLTVYKHPARSFGSDETFSCDSCGKWHTEREVVERMAARQRELKGKAGRKTA